MFPSMATNIPSNMISQLSHGMYEVGATNNDLVGKNIDSANRPNEEEHASLNVCSINKKKEIRLICMEQGLLPV